MISKLIRIELVSYPAPPSLLIISSCIFPPRHHSISQGRPEVKNTLNQAIFT